MNTNEVLINLAWMIPTFVISILVPLIHSFFFRNKLIYSWDFYINNLKIPKLTAFNRLKALKHLIIFQISWTLAIILGLITLSKLLKDYFYIIFLCMIFLVILRVYGYVSIITMYKRLKKYCLEYNKFNIDYFYEKEEDINFISKNSYLAINMFLKNQIKIKNNNFKFFLSMKKIEKSLNKISNPKKKVEYLDDICFLDEGISEINKIAFTREMMSHLRLTLIEKYVTNN
ncbi:Uncharacterised protein [Metamycoplasma arthritidis]|uniref:Hypothetical membrane protein n=2 Tax=Metamycoplasma arthritidis TaxID=2111 RepID=B3PMW7_META1|nr:hypothetical membrane protein [Metamycoplasma arthritidis 158L3-1]VEU78889.1 Uncharacterised protein [Metamycoplasma arthritidis]